MIVGVEPADIANLSAGIGVEGRVVEHDLAALAGLQLLHADSGAVLRLDDRQHSAGGERLVIALEDSCAAAIDKPGWPLLRAALPGSLRALALLVHGGVETGSVENDALIAASVFDEITRQTKSVVELEMLLARDKLPSCRVV